MISEQEYAARGLEWSRQANVVDTLHGYFLQQVTRLHKTILLFGLFDRPLGKVLDIGPFYSYTPLVLRPHAASYTVLEGDDPAAYPLKPLYEQQGIQVQFVDLFEMFGPTRHAPHAFPYPDGSFDTVLCWETMEHFNFNPVKFVKELRRILTPGGQACVTVPNRASFQNLAGLLLGKRDRQRIEAYFQYEDYVSNGKKAFYGFHWHEYTVTELGPLFERAGFQLKQCSTMVAFQEHAHPSLARRCVRKANAVAGRLLPRFGTHVYVQAQKVS